MEIKKTHYQNIPVLSLSGRLDNKGASVLENTYSGITESSPTLILNLKNVDYLSSIGIRILLKIEKEFRQKQKQLLFCNLSPNVIQVLNIAGLINILNVFENEENAFEYLINKNRPVNTNNFSSDGIDYILRYDLQEESHIDIWSTGNSENELPIPVNLKELGFAFGLAGLGLTSKAASNEIGNFTSTGKVVGVTPAGKAFHPDFNISSNPDENIVYISRGIGLTGNPAFNINVKSKKEFSLKNILPVILDAASKQSKTNIDFAGLVLFGNATEIKSNFYQSNTEIEINKPAGTHNINNKIIASTGILSNSDMNDFDSSYKKELSYFLKENYIDENIHFFSGGIIIESPQDLQLKIPEDINNIITLDNLESTIILDANTKFTALTIWLYIPKTIRSGAEKRLNIEVRNGEPLSDEDEVVARNIYSDSIRIILEPLSGGYSANTYRVFSYDNDGRELLPTVMKIGMKDWIDREITAYHKYVKKFILNNSTTILGTAEYGVKGGLRYNFLGITGSGGKLSMLRDLYMELSVEELQKIFLKVFTSILKPWYGQPKWEVSYPFVEHNPSRIFKNICEDAETFLGISAEQQTIYCEELERELPNPYHFLKYGYIERKNKSLHWYKSIIHGDLNLANIMLDDKDNLYIIDFSETRESNILSDLGRIEPIIKIEMSNLENENDLKDFLLFEYELARINSINEIPEFIYHGKDSMINKAFPLIKLFRKLAGKMTIFESNPIPYFLALLEWTLPMASYRNFPLIRKKASAYSAAILIERILKLEKDF